MKIQDFVVLDLETTGLSVKEDQILEIGAVKVQGGEVTASYETFVNPGRKVPERITELLMCQKNIFIPVHWQQPHF